MADKHKSIDTIAELGEAAGSIISGPAQLAVRSSLEPIAKG